MKKVSLIHLPCLLALALCLIVGAGCTKASKARRRLAAADKAFQAQKYDDAEIEYRSVLSLSRANPIAIRQLGLIYFEEGRLVDALGVLQLALKQDTNNLQVQLKLAELYQARGELTNGLGLVGLVLHADPGNARALILLAKMCPSNDLSSVAQRMETQLQEGGQGEAACHTALGWIDLRTHKLSEAESEFQKASALDPKLDAPYLGMVTLYTLRRDTKEAAQALKTAAELSPIRSPTRLNYAELKRQIGDVDEAKEMVFEITRKAPDYMPAWLFLMNVAFAEHKYDECKADIDKILARDNYNGDAMSLSGTIALEQHDGPKAVGVFQRLKNLYQNVPEVRYNLAKAYLLNGEKQKAVASLNDALDLAKNRDYPAAALLLASLDARSDKLSESAALLSQSVKYHPNDIEAQMGLAETYLAQNQPERALEVYDQMTQKTPRNAEIPRLMGIAYLMQRNPAKARAAFEKSLALAPDYSRTLDQLTQMDISEKRFADAHHRLDQVVVAPSKESSKIQGDIEKLQGDVYAKEGEITKAETAYSKAIELNPELSFAYFNLVELYLHSHQEQHALDRLGELAAKDTNDVKPLMKIGMIQQQMGHYDKAAEAYEKALTIDSNDFYALNNLAYVDSEYLNKVDKALELAEKAKKLHPYDAVASDTLGWILFKKHDYARALNSIQESAEKHPEDPEVQMHLGMAYYMMGQETPARDSLKRALNSSADFPGKDLVRRRLEVLDIDPATAGPETVQKLESLAHENPQDPVLKSRLAAIQEQQGQTQKAADSLEALLSILPQDWSAMVRLARLYAGPLKDLHKALDLAKSAHGLAPDDGQTSALLGELVYRTGDYPWALSLLEESAHRLSDQPALSYHLALAYYAVGRTADADAAMQKAEAPGASPTDLLQAKQFIAMRAAVNDPAQAQASSAQVTQILAQDPKYVPALMVSGLLAERQNAVDQAVQTYQNVLSIYPLFTPAMRQLAILYNHRQQTGDLEKAYDLANKARASLPDDLELARMLGLLTYRRGDYNKSIALLNDYTEKSSDDAEAFYYLGMDYYKVNQTNSSQKALQRALDLHVPETLASQARGIFKSLK
jgi:tetratricopeptide (TPR) repeat protein